MTYRRTLGAGGPDDGCAASFLPHSRRTLRGGWREVHNSVPSLGDFSPNFFWLSDPSELLLISVVVQIGGFPDLRAACLLCAGPRCGAARSTGCETQPPRSCFFSGQFSDAILAMLSMRGHFTKRLVQRDGCTGGLWSPLKLVAQTGPATTASSCKFHVNKPTAGLPGNSEPMPSRACTVALLLAFDWCATGGRHKDEPCMGCGVEDPSRGGSARG